MSCRTAVVSFLTGVILIALSPRVYGDSAKVVKDPRLSAARRYVEQSDRYLHHSKLGRGMKGYGRTVLGGTQIVQFDVEILSVLTKWGPHQDVILGRLSGQGLEKTGVVSGMSGSPVYVRHEGKDKLVGAIAYTFYAQKEPICGIQPITQMLVLREGVSKPEESPPPAEKIPAPPAASAPPEYLKRVLSPGKIDILQIVSPKRGYPRRGDMIGDPRLVSITTPLMIAGIGRKYMVQARELLQPMGFVPVQAGGLSAAEALASADAKLEPGAAISVPFVTGDADWYAVGTVTEVIGDRILALGHSFFAEGEIDLPMGPAYVHTIVPGLLESFKLTSTLRVTGSLNRDEYVGVAGRIGGKASMIPLTVTVEWKNENRRQSFRYNVCRHRWLTPMLVSLLIGDSAWGWRELPQYHTVRHSVQIDFGELGRYETKDISSGQDVLSVVSDGIRPVGAMFDNPFGPAPEIRKIDVQIAIESSQTSADILELRLDGNVYRPGEALSGNATIRPFRKSRVTVPVRFVLPDDLPDGKYSLTVCDGASAMRLLQREKPQRFDPRTVPQLLQALQRVVEPNSGSLYLRLPLPRGGVAIRHRELPDLPDSKARILSEAVRLDTHTFSEALVRSVQTEYVLRGSASASFEVRKHPKETLMRQRRNPKQ